MRVLKSFQTFGGLTQFLEHDSKETGTTMKLSWFLPSRPAKGCLFWLSGLTCTEENFIVKAGAQRYLEDHGLMVVCPDTSPRGLNLPGEHDAWDFGSGAGFYVDATTKGYADHYRMYSYITRELYDLIEGRFAMKGRISISGHSMGGHGALVMGLREPNRFRSISAIAPIVHPTVVPWGEKAFQGYLGNDPGAWKSYDATELLRSGSTHPREILIDQGLHDEFLDRELRSKDFSQAAGEARQAHKLRFHEGYDHSHFFIASFIGEHIAFHAL